MLTIAQPLSAVFIRYGYLRWCWHSCRFGLAGRWSCSFSSRFPRPVMRAYPSSSWCRRRIHSGREACPSGPCLGMAEGRSLAEAPAGGCQCCWRTCMSSSWTSWATLSCSLGVSGQRTIRTSAFPCSCCCSCQHSSEESWISCRCWS